MNISNEKNMKEYMITQYPNEGCGFVVDGKFVPCVNRAKDPTQDFVISSDDSKTIPTDPSTNTTSEI